MHCAQRFFVLFHSPIPNNKLSMYLASEFQIRAHIKNTFGASNMRAEIEYDH